MVVGLYTDELINKSSLKSYRSSILPSISVAQGEPVVIRLVNSVTSTYPLVAIIWMNIQMNQVRAIVTSTRRIAKAGRVHFALRWDDILALSGLALIKLLQVSNDDLYLDRSTTSLDGTHQNIRSRHSTYRDDEIRRYSSLSRRRCRCSRAVRRLR